MFSNFKIYLCFSFFFIMCAVSKIPINNKYNKITDSGRSEDPSFVVINDDTIDKEKRSILKRPCKKITFIEKNGIKSMNEEDLKDLSILKYKYSKTKNCAGLAAPQIGIAKCMIVFGCEADEEIKKYRKDLTQEIPNGTIWINPSYKPINDTQRKDVEGCFSINDTRVLVKRYTEIEYEAYLPNGEKIKGTAKGFLARIIQHEIDHLNGILCRDRVENNEMWTDEEYKKNRNQILASLDKSIQ